MTRIVDFVGLLQGQNVKAPWDAEASRLLLYEAEDTKGYMNSDHCS
jgi:hypothetical protein